MDGKTSRRPSKSQNRKSQKSIRHLRDLPMPNLAAFNIAQQQQQQQYLQQHQQYQHLQTHDRQEQEHQQPGQQQQHSQQHQQYQPLHPIGQQQQQHKKIEAQEQQLPPETSSKAQHRAEGHSRIPTSTRHGTSDSQQDAGRDVSKPPPSVQIDGNNNVVDTARTQPISESQLQSLQMPVVSEDQITVPSSSCHQQSLGRLEQAADEPTNSSEKRGQITSDKNKDQTVPQSLPACGEVMDANERKPVATGISAEMSEGQRSSRRSKSSSAHGRRRSYHDIRGGAWSVCPTSSQPLQWESFGKCQVEEPSTRNLPPHFDPIMSNQCKQPRPRSCFENWSNSSGGRAGPHNVFLHPAWPCPQPHEIPRLFDISGNSLPESDMWRNGHRKEGSGHGATSNHSWAFSGGNHLVGDGKNSCYKYNSHQDPKRRLSEAPPARLRRNAVRSPDSGRNAYPRDREVIDFERNSMNHDPTPAQGYQLFENDRRRQSRFDQFLFSADFPPPPIHSTNSVQQHSSAHGNTDTELPRSIGHMLNNRGRPVETYRYQGHGRSRSPRRGNGFHMRGSQSNRGQALHKDYLNAQSRKGENEGCRTCSNPQSCYNKDKSATCMPSGNDLRCSKDGRTKTGDNAVNEEHVQIESSKTGIAVHDFSNGVSVFPQAVTSQIEISTRSNFVTDTHGKEGAVSGTEEKSNQPQHFEDGHQDSNSLPASTSEKPIAAHSSRDRNAKMKDTDVPLSEKFSQLDISEPAPKGPEASSVSDAQQDLEMMQKMGLPIKDSKKEKPDLNPRAQEFTAVPIKDGSGNLYTMTTQKGVCFFRPVASADHVSPDPRYVIQSDMHQGMNGSIADIASSKLTPEPFAAPISLTTDRHMTQNFMQNQQPQLYIQNGQENDHNFLHMIQNQVQYHSQDVKQQMPFNTVPLIDQPFTPQPFTPLVPLQTPMFTFPGQVAIEMNMVAPQEFEVPIVQSVPCGAPQEHHFQQANLYEGKVQTHAFSTPQSSQNLIPPINNANSIQPSPVIYNDLNSGHRFNPLMARNDCIPLNQFQKNNGMAPSQVNTPPGNLPFLTHQPLVPPPLATPNLPDAFPHHGQIIIQDTPPVPRDITLAKPVYHTDYGVDTQTIQIEQTTEQELVILHHSPGLKKDLYDAPNGDSSFGARQDERSLYEKVKDTLQEVRQSLRPHDPKEVDKVDKHVDSEDSQMLTVELSEVVNKLAIICQRGKKATLQRHIANAPAHLRPTLELMLRFLCILSEEKTDLSSASFSKLVQLCRGLTSNTSSSGTVQSLLNLLPEVGSQTHGEGVSSSGLEQLILKSMEEVQVGNTSDASLTNIGEISSTSKSIDQITSKSQGFEPNIAQNSDHNGTNNTEAHTSQNISSDHSSIQPYTHLDLPAPTPEQKIIDQEVDLKNNQAGKEPTQNTRNNEPNGPPETYAKDESGSVSVTISGSAVETLADHDASQQSRNGTPHPTPRHRSLQRVNRRSPQHVEHRSPAFDKVDIASRIGVFERMRSKR